ncbi:LPS-assembly lipoprotein LptE [Chitinimonas lacunae]|uniref:LPS-assembly lipoprotein LptE n=1 Tax=Chitinimonas lacunae TaxID=1963018 RepID=A0ABV8MU00_9NEIS
MLRSRLLALALPLLLGACGFHLRGLGDSTPLAFRSLHLAASDQGVGGVLRQQLKLRADLTLQPTADQADAVLTIHDETVDKQVLSVNSAGRVSEYQLTYRARFVLRIGGRDAIAPTWISLRRDYAFDENNVLGKEAEEQLLIRDMRSDAAQQILRRLAAVKPPVS